MITRFRAFQIAINGVLFIPVTYFVFDLIAELDWWRINQWFWREMLALMMCSGLLGSLVGSAGLNVHILRHNNARILLPTRIMPQVFFLILSVAMLYFTLKLESFIAFSYDGHLSKHYMDIKLPEWPWLKEMPVFYWDEDFLVIVNFQILFFLLFPFGVTLLIAFHNTGLIFSAVRVQHDAISATLLKWHITLGVLLVFFSLFALFDFITIARSFVSDLNADPSLLNSGNVASLAIACIFYLLLLAYGQWILRDGIRLRKHNLKQRIRV